MATLQEEAEAEFAAELRRQQINVIKDTLRERRMRPWWVRLFPFRIHITRRSAPGQPSLAHGSGASHMKVRHQHQAGRRFHIDTGPNTPPDLRHAIGVSEARIRPILPLPTSTLWTYVLAPLWRSLRGIPRAWPDRTQHRREMFLRAASIKAQTGMTDEASMRAAIEGGVAPEMNFPPRII